MAAVIGTAGWSIASADAAKFPAEGTSLQRYSQVFNGVEINSSFYRAHRASTWARWAADVPENFRFAVKIPKAITHVAKLVDAEEMVEEFAENVKFLGTKLGVLLVQLPPKLGFATQVAERFFKVLRQAIDAPIACEPRNLEWFTDEADATLNRLRVSRVAADPAIPQSAAMPGGWKGLTYWRLHGSPVIYRSPYDAAALDIYAQQLHSAIAEGGDAWCVFDNTASSAATADALSLMTKM